MDEWLWEARAESLVLNGAIDSVMEEVRDLLASESDEPSLSFHIRLSIEELLMRNPALSQRSEQDSPHVVSVWFNRREYVIRVDAVFGEFVFPNL